MPKPPTPGRGGAGRAALLVAAGIFLSRIAGLVRQRVLAHYLGGTSAAADAFLAAIRIPNFLQNLFGEGVLSASFIPVYAGLMARGEKEAAKRVAGAIAALLALVTSVLVLAGVLAAPFLTDLIAPGFEGEKRELTIQLVRVLFPGAGLLVLSAWCLGILNSHGRFFLSYAAPVIWNAAIIVGLVFFGGTAGPGALALVAAVGAVVGSALQFAVQLPAVLRLLGGLRPALDVASPGVRTVVRNFGPVFVGRGVVQISAYVDEILASLLPTGAVSALAYAQVLYTLPVSLFGMAVSAAELPAMSSAVGSEREVAEYLRGRLNAGLRRIAFLVVPSAVAFAALGDVVAAAIYQSGRFTSADAVYVWAVLAGWSVGLLAATLGRLYSSTYYALGDTRAPLRYAVVHVVLAAALGYVLAFPLPPAIGLDPRWGVAGLTIAASFGSWAEFGLLRRTLNNRIGATGLPIAYAMRLTLAAAAGAAAGWAVKLALPGLHPVPLAAVTLGPYGLVYFAVTSALGVPEASEVTGRAARITRRLRR
jgi:putative peptidoglycan lipid II flippase